MEKFGIGFGYAAWRGENRVETDYEPLDLLLEHNGPLTCGASGDHDIRLCRQALAALYAAQPSSSATPCADHRELLPYIEGALRLAAQLLNKTADDPVWLEAASVCGVPSMFVRTYWLMRKRVTDAADGGV